MVLANRDGAHSPKGYKISTVENFRQEPDGSYRIFVGFRPNPSLAPLTISSAELSSFLLFHTRWKEIHVSDEGEGIDSALPKVFGLMHIEIGDFQVVMSTGFQSLACIIKLSRIFTSRTMSKLSLAGSQTW